MGNSIEFFKTYIALLDEVYKQASCTAVLDGNNALAQQGVRANEIVIPKLSMDGLADYDRNSGYIQGNDNLTLETVKFNYDRGRKFSVDAMDNDETAGVAFGMLSSEFVRTKSTPELDAFRFAKYAGTDGISTGYSSGALTTGESTLNALVAAQTKMDEDEVDPNDRYLFITPTLLNLVNNVDTTKSKAVLDSFASITKVPQSRFYTAIDLLDGKTKDETEDIDETAGGYQKAENGKDINFMIIQKSAVIQYPKHTVNKVVSPDENQSSDSWLFFFRAYGLADVYENKRAGIYLHYKV